MPGRLGKESKEGVFYRYNFKQKGQHVQRHGKVKGEIGQE